MKHLKLLAAIFAAALTLLVGACSGTQSAADSVTDAETALAQQQYDRAKQLANDIMTQNMDKLTANDLCRLSLVYMQLSEQPGQDYEQNVASAALCLRQAIKLDPKGVDEILANLSTDHQALISTAQQLAQSDSTATYGEFEGEMHDSLPDFETIHAPHQAATSNQHP